MDLCRFVPPYLLSRLAELDGDDLAQRVGRATLAADRTIRDRRHRIPPAPLEHPSASGQARWAIHSAADSSDLPDPPVRIDGQPPTGDAAIDEAYAAAEAAWRLFAEVFEYPGVDGQGSPVVATVHYGSDYANAFWDGRQMVLGAGDGVIFDRMTAPIDALAHEYAHGVTQYTAALAYDGQPGAVHESLADVFASMVKQRVLGQTVDEADWLIGEGLFGPDVDGRALRSMREPGTAYDDPRIGKDPQAATMRDYVETGDDNGGVHINSGIPNRAFCLAATSLGGGSWEGAGPIWWAALVGGHVTAVTGFVDFATATLDATTRLYGAGSAEWTAIRSAWTDVGVLTPESDDADQTTRIVSVRRSGGFAGRVTEREIDLATDPAGAEAAALLRRIDLGRIPKTAPQPDRFVYTVRTGDHELRFHEQDLTPELRQLVELILARDDDTI